MCSSDLVQQKILRRKKNEKEIYLEESKKLTFNLNYFEKKRDRKSVVQGKSVDLGGRRIIKKKKERKERRKREKKKKEQR